jgi:hypothetical protein
MLRRGDPGKSGRLSGYARALLAALMIVFGLLLFTIVLASVISPSN